MAGQKKKGGSKAKTIQSSDGEGFDFNVSDSSSDSAAATGVRHTGSRTSRPRAAPAAAVELTVVNPIGPTPPTVLVNADATKILAPIPTTGSTCSLQAQDTNHFYTKREIEIKGEKTVRKVCTLCW